MSDIIADFDKMMEAALAPETLAIIAEKEPDRLFQIALQEPVITVITLLDSMENERKQVKQHPWLYGQIFWWLKQREPFADDMIRFQLLQQAGYWADSSFAQFCSQYSQVSEVTWSAWIHNVEVYLHTEAGQAVLEQAGLEPDDFVENVTFDKANRAVATVAAEKIAPHQIEVLTDPESTSEDMRLALRTQNPEKYEKMMNESQALEQRQNEIESRKDFVYVEYDQAQRTVKLVARKGEKVDTSLVARFPVPSEMSQAIVVELQRSAVEAMKKRLKELTDEQL